MLSSQRAMALGTVLVLAQFGLMSWLVVLGASALLPWPSGLRLGLAALLALAGAALGAAALRANRPGNFNIHPAPREGGQLVEHGPYRWLRHPMYSAVLLLCAAAAVLAASWTGLLAWLLLLAVLVAKALIEERWLAERHAGYAAYCRRTARLLPRVF
jgi:protein-S-isoprenylcysteine O-methyltransferase Ste14